MAILHAITASHSRAPSETSNANGLWSSRYATMPNSARPDPPTVMGRLPIALAPMTAMIESNAPTE